MGLDADGCRFKIAPFLNNAQAIDMDLEFHTSLSHFSSSRSPSSFILQVLRPKRLHNRIHFACVPFPENLQFQLIHPL